MKMTIFLNRYLWISTLLSVFSIYILEISPPVRCWICENIFSSWMLHCVLLAVSCALQKLFSFMRSLSVDLTICIVGVLFRMLSPVPLHSMLFPTFSSMGFSASKIYIKVFYSLAFEIFSVTELNLSAF